MKIFMNKKIWQKIVLVILIFLLFQFVTTKPVHALPGDTLLEPVTSLFANLGDGIMNIMQQTIMGMDSSGAWIEQDSTSFWKTIAIIGIAILAATVAVVSIIATGGLSLGVIATAVGAVLKIGGVAVAVYCASTFSHFGENGFFLPEYELTPQAIFQDEILAFDVNFFNPKKSKIEQKTHEEYVAIELEGTEYESTLGTGKGMEKTYKLTRDQVNKFDAKYGFDANKISNTVAPSEENIGVNTTMYLWSYKDKNYKMYRQAVNQAVDERRLYCFSGTQNSSRFCRKRGFFRKHASTNSR
ncbi:MAG: hypothetical protein ACI4VH_02675 [Clostridia bacterium]